MEFRIEQTTEQDIETVIRIIFDVYDRIPEEQKAWFAVDAPDDTREMLRSGAGMCYKAVETESGVIAGVLTVVIPGKESFNLGYDLGFTEAELMTTAHLDTAAILPQYRGHQLQKRLMAHAEEILYQQGFRILCCTAHPENVYSQANIRKNGFEVRMTKEKYGGYLRNIFCKRL